MTSREFQDRLARRARRAGTPLSQDLAARLETYFRLLETWNRKINLTGLNLAELAPETIDRLLVEPLVAARHIPPGATRMIDIGSFLIGIVPLLFIGLQQIEVVTLASDSVPTTGSSSTIAASEARR